MNRLAPLHPSMQRRPDRTSQREPAPRRRSEHRVFSSVALQAGGCKRTIVFLSREGDSPCVLISLALPDGRVTRLRIGLGAEAELCTRTVKLARSARELSFEVGKIVLGDGAYYLVSARSQGGTPGFSYRLVAADGTARGKPKTLWADEFTALEAALLTLTGKETTK